MNLRTKKNIFDPFCFNKHSKWVSQTQTLHKSEQNTLCTVNTRNKNNDLIKQLILSTKMNKQVKNIIKKMTIYPEVAVTGKVAY